jgi:hypothetical protein
VRVNPQTVIDIALAEVGYHEKASNDQLEDKTANSGDGNYTKYAIDLWAHKYFNGSKAGVEWCSVFVSWCYVKAYGLDAALSLLCQKLGSAAAGVKYAMQYFQEAGRFFGAPKPYDVIFFGRGHMGIVYDVDNTYVYTVEGNTENQVLEHRYRINDEQIAGYGRPDYDGAPDAAEPMEEWPVKKMALVVSGDGNPVRLRSSTSTKKADNTIEKVPVWTAVEVVEQGTRDGVEWSTIITPEGKRGYMMSKFLRMEPENAEKTPEELPSIEAYEQSVLSKLDALIEAVNKLAGGVG